MKEIVKIFIKLLWNKIMKTLIKYKIVKLENEIEKDKEALDEKIDDANRDYNKLMSDYDEFLRRVQNGAEELPGLHEDVRDSGNEASSDNKGLEKTDPEAGDSNRVEE